MNLKLFSIITSIIIVYILLINSIPKYSTEDFALGNQTTKIFSKHNGNIHFDKINDSIIYFIESLNNKSNKEVIFIFGNSQSHSINQIKQGDKTYIKLLAQNKLNSQILAHTMPNANLQEILYSYSF